MASRNGNRTSRAAKSSTASATVEPTKNQRRRVFDPGPDGGRSSRFARGGGAVGPELMEFTIAHELQVAEQCDAGGRALGHLRGDARTPQTKTGGAPLAQHTPPVFVAYGLFFGQVLE